MLRRLVTILMIIIGYLLQSTLFSALSLGGVAPNILLILTASFGFMRGQKEGMYVGFISGILLDIIFGNLLGFYALVYLVIGYLNGFFSDLFFPEDIKLPMALISSSELIFCIIIYVFKFLIQGRTNFGYYFLHLILPEIVYTILVTILVYKGILFVNERLEDFERRRA